MQTLKIQHFPQKPITPILILVPFKTNEHPKTSIKHLKPSNNQINILIIPKHFFNPQTIKIILEHASYESI